MGNTKKIVTYIVLLLLCACIFYSPLLFPILHRALSRDYKECYNLIADDFNAANENNLFKIKNARSQGSLFFDISAKKIGMSTQSSSSSSSSSSTHVQSGGKSVTIRFTDPQILGYYMKVTAPDKSTYTKL